MNGPAVSPARKTENAPTWRPQNPDFQTRFLVLFWREIELDVPVVHHTAHRITLAHIFYFIYNYISTTGCATN